jgi:31-O-methyltransferase
MILGYANNPGYARCRIEEYAPSAATRSGQRSRGMRVNDSCGAEQIILPDGTPWLCPRQADAMMIWREIFGDHCYRDAARTVPRGGIVFDVGAHTGLASLYFCRNIENPRIFAFEPAAELYRCLSVNLERYVSHASPIPFALSNKSETSPFIYYPDAPSQSGLFADPAKDCEVTAAYLVNQGADLDDAQYLSSEIHTPRDEMVRVTTLSAALAELNVEIVDLLKLDVERSELAVLEGIANDDWRRIKSIVIEVHDSNDRLGNCAAMLKGKGYELTISQAAWLTDTELFNVMAIRQ